MSTSLPMICNQCEQTAHGQHCEINSSPGVCGKDKDVESLQQMLLYGLKGMAACAHHARRLGKSDDAVNAFIEGFSRRICGRTVIERLTWGASPSAPQTP